MEDQFFDVSVQLCILGYLLDETDKKQCFDLVSDLLTDTKFQEWTSELKMEEIEHTAWLFINHNDSHLLDDVKVALPKAMKKLIQGMQTLQSSNELELEKLKHTATKQTFRRTQCIFKEILQNQQNKIYELEWKQL